MLNLLFSPSGRISSSEFMTGAYVLIAAAFIIALLPLISYALAAPFGFLGLVMIYCWVVLWVKRYHDGGKSGWTCLLPIVVFLVLSLIAGMVVSMMGLSGIDPAMESQMNEAAESGDLSGMFSMLMGATGDIAKKTAIPNAISGAVVSLIVVFIFNGMIKGDPGENQFGPAT